MDTVLKVIEVATAVVTGASIMLVVISKLTSNTVDDEVSTWVSRLKSILEKLAINVKAP